MSFAFGPTHGTPDEVLAQLAALNVALEDKARLDGVVAAVKSRIPADTKVVRVTVHSGPFIVDTGCAEPGCSNKIPSTCQLHPTAKRLTQSGVRDDVKVDADMAFSIE